MIRGIYTSGSGLLAESKRHDTIANNLANANTTGFKKELSVFMAHPEMNIHRINDDTLKTPFGSVDKRPFIGTLGTGAQLDENYTSFEQGQIANTGNKTDLAISQNGFFAVVDSEGNVNYTRDGSFVIDSNNYLVDKSGRNVLGYQGAIRIQGDDFTIRDDGQIWVDEQLTETVALVDFENVRGLEKIGDNLYSQTEESGQPNIIQGQIHQYALEKSNVNAVEEMVNMISAVRAYETNSRLVQVHDETIGKAVNEVGRLT